MHRFFISPENIYETYAVIDPEQARHIERVLRLKNGDHVLAFDGQGKTYELSLLERTEGELRAAIINMQFRSAEPSLRISLVQGMAKGDKMDTIIQKAVEIGVSKIYPLISQHSVIRLDTDRALRKTERWRTIAREACKQCRRNEIPSVEMPISLGDLLENCKDKPVVFLYENERQTSLKSVISANRQNFAENEIFLVVGPEGGFSLEEVSQAQQQGAYLAGLGPRILRTETAGLVAAAILLYEMGDLE